MRKVIITIFFLCLFFPSLVEVFAANVVLNQANVILDPPPSTVNLTNPLGSVDDIPTLIGRIISGVLGVVGSLALVMFIYGGFTWMLAAGNSEKVKTGRDIIIWAAIGLVVIFTSYALVTFIIKAIA